MLGAMIGDIAGSKYEFNNTFDYDFEMFGEGCDFTDDTICTVAIADAILNGRSYQESLLDWCRRYPSPKGAYGGRFAGWIRSLDPQPYNSFGNGSAMRVSPVAHAIWHFRKSRFSEESKECKDKNSKESDDKAMKAFKDIARSYYEDFDTRDYPKGKFDETCMDAVPLSFYLLSQASSFEDAIRLAISHGGDSDTIGAIVGSIAEARFGIPQEMKEKAISYLPDDMREISARIKCCN